MLPDRLTATELILFSSTSRLVPNPVWKLRSRGGIFLQRTRKLRPSAELVEIVKLYNISQNRFRLLFLVISTRRCYEKKFGLENYAQGQFCIDFFLQILTRDVESRYYSVSTYFLYVLYIVNHFCKSFCKYTIYFKIIEIGDDTLYRQLYRCSSNRRIAK